jgi:formylglycine-generating enzyme
MVTQMTIVAVSAVVLACVSGARATVDIETVPVGNPGNAGDTRYPSGGVSSFGAVGYTYNIGTYEVTAGQYTEFLNAVAATDTYGLYNQYMWESYAGCRIQRSGSAGSYTYSVASDWSNRPVNRVGWDEAARFCNWLHNGQPTGVQGLSTTENGSYFLNGATSDTALTAVTRTPGATWAIPTEGEWYKAAYHKNDGVTGHYWNFPTSSNSYPSNVLGDPTDPGNNATYYDNGFTIGSPYYRTEVGAHENSEGPYGTFDQGGNVWEWNEAIVYETPNYPYRGLRGGAYRGG